MSFSQIGTLSVKPYYTYWTLEPFFFGQITFPAQSAAIFTKGIWCFDGHTFLGRKIV